jgi:tetratricopeptide (TPR) repeat protein
MPAATAAPLRAGRWLILALLAAATFAAFAGVLRNGWILLDDPRYVYSNPHVVRGWTVDGARWFLREPHGGNWHPLTSWSHMLDAQIFGLQPAGHHAVNLLLHTLNALLLLIVLHRLTGAWWRSVLVASFFALHPLRVESVAWVSERKDVLSGIFFFLVVESYRRWAVRPAPWRFALVVAALVLGLLSKPMLVTLPALLVLLDVWPLGRLAGLPRPPFSPAGSRATAAAADPSALPRARARSLAGLIGEKWPLFALAAVSAIVTMTVQQRMGAVVPVGVLPIAPRLGNALISYWRYVGKTLWPSHLTPHYPYGPDPAIAVAVAAAAGLAAVTVAVLWQARARPYLAVGWFWYVGMLVPVIGLVQVGGQAYADRYTYLPGIGLLVAGVWGVADLVAGSRLGRAMAAVASAIALAGLALATTRQVALWKDTRTLFTHTVAVTRDNLYAEQYVGAALLQSGETRLAIPHLQRVLNLPPNFEDSLRRVLDSNPGDLETRRLLASTLVRETRVEEAIRTYGEILRRNPGDLDALNNVAWIRATCEEASQRNGAEAVRLAEQARDRCPQPVAVLYSTLAAAYAEAGRFPEAVRACERAIQLAQAGHQTREAERYAQQLARYRAGKPFNFEE